MEFLFQGLSQESLWLIVVFYDLTLVVLLYKLFGKERVEKELEEFLSFDFFPRSGGGIGVTRIMQAIPD